MVSTYYIMKLFRKATDARSRRNLDEHESPASTPQHEDGFHLYKCRICLKEGRTYGRIYGEQDLSTDICTFGYIEMSADDEYPKYICDICHKLLDAAIIFRKTAKNSDNILRNAVFKYKCSSNKLHNPQNVDENIQDNPKTSTPVLQNFFSVVLSDNEIISSDDSKALKSRTKITKVQCKICFKIITKAYYKEHFALHDQTMTKYVCDICGRSFRQRCSYRNHCVTHSSEFPYKCQLCPYRGRNSALLKTHMRTHTCDYRYMCTECPARFITKSNLNKHSLKHKDPLYKCDKCQRGFHSKLNLERHFEADHLGIKNHICSVCGKAFGYRKAMMQHQLGVHKREKKLNGRTPSYMEAETKKNEDCYL